MLPQPTSLYYMHIRKSNTDKICTEKQCVYTQLTLINNVSPVDVSVNAKLRCIHKIISSNSYTMLCPYATYHPFTLGLQSNHKNAKRMDPQHWKRIHARVPLVWKEGVGEMLIHGPILISNAAVVATAIRSPGVHRSRYDWISFRLHWNSALAEIQRTLVP